MTAIEIIERKLAEVKSAQQCFANCNPSQMVDIQEYAWRAVGYHLNEVLTEIKGVQSSLT